MLRRQGVKHVFGVPGVQTMPLYEGIYDSQGDVVHVCMRDERGAAFAVEAYAKVSRRPGVCDATVGPGNTNLPSGVCEAYNGSVPMPSDVAPVLKEARGLGEPALLDVRIDNVETPVIPYQEEVDGSPSFG